MGKKSKLTDDEMKIFLEKVESVDKRVDHSNAMRCMSNETRREFLNFIGYDVKSMGRTQEKATPRGIGFMENAILEES